MASKQEREPAAEQLNRFKASQKTFYWQQPLQSQDTLTTSNGAPIGDKLASMTVGGRGPMLLQDVVFLDEMAHFDRERIPERVVHAKGAGAHGYLEVTHDITRYTKATPFDAVGKKTPLFIRFSTVGGESGSADTARDPRGFAVKFYTEHGNWDLVGNNTPIFFIRDPLMFPNFVHTQKRNPVTHLKDADMTWDFIGLRPESTHQVMFLFSDRGTPDGYRFMNGYGSHTFKLVNSKNEAVYCKFHLKSAQGIKNLPSDRAEKLGGIDPDYAIRDLYNAIEKKQFPTWNFYIQVMTFAEAEKHQFNPFDLTKVWSHKEFPLIPVGKVVLDKNPANYFAEVEQSAFSPAHLIPGIEPSPDRVLQGRLFAYTDTHFHRLGPNYRQLPINCPYRARVANTQRDGGQCMQNQAGAPNYHPSSFNGPIEHKNACEHRQQWTGDVSRYNNADEDNFTQPREFWEKVLDDAARKRLVSNLAGALIGAQDFIQDRVINNFGQVHPDFASMLKEALNAQKRLLNSEATAL